MIEKQSRINNWSISVTLHHISWIALAGTTVKVGLGLYLIKLDKVCDCFFASGIVCSSYDPYM